MAKLTDKQADVTIFFTACKAQKPMSNEPIIQNSSDQESGNIHPSQSNPRGKFFLYFLLILLSVTAVWFLRQPRVQATIIDWPNHSLWDNVKRLVGADEKELRGEKEGRINFLLLGQGGPGHSGPYLTDTIILASLDVKTKTVGLLSIPRDLAVNIPGYGYRKINNANAFGEQAGPGQGSQLSKQVVTDAFGIPIHYYARLDFSGFVSIVNALGGLPINVEKNFADNQFPASEDGPFKTVKFEAGWQLMSGEKALDFVRSRHGTNDQASDFSRAKRQQLILLALKQKLLSPATFLNPRLAINLYKTFNASVDTDISAQEAVKLAHLLKDVSADNIRHIVLDNSPTGYLKDSIGNEGAYLLVPKSGNYNDLKILAQNLLDNPELNSEKATLYIENGTGIAGLADTVADKLKLLGWDKVEFGNAAKSDFQGSLLYDYTKGTKLASRQYLEKNFSLKALDPDPNDNNVQYDFKLILGRDQLSNQ